MRKNMHNKVEKRAIKLELVLFLMIILVALVSAENKPFLYNSNPVVPEQGSLEVQGDLNVDLFTGAAVYNYPIDVSPGTNGLAPIVNLFYNSQAIKGNPGITGNGWKLTESYIQRDTNNSFDNVTGDSYRLVLEGVPYELAYDSDDERFHTKIESFLNIKNMSGGADNDYEVYWEIKKTDGTNYRFGYFNFSETKSNLHDYVWRWNLDLINDTYDNKVFYNYTENKFAEDNGTVYLDSVFYNNDKQRKIDFTYELTDRPDLRSVYEEGNNVKISRRLKEVGVYVNNNQIKRYVLKYNVPKDVSTLSYLVNITEIGEGNITDLPPKKFVYNEANEMNEVGGFGWRNETKLVITDSNCFVSSGFEDRGLRLVDFNRDGLLDLQSGAVINYTSLVNTKNGWVIDERWVSPIYYVDTVNHVDQGARIVDINNDGLQDVLKGVINTQAGNGLCALGYQRTSYIHNGTNWTGSNETAPPVCFSRIPNHEDSGARIVDINNDGFPDILLGNGTDSRAYIHDGSGWVEDNLFAPPMPFSWQNYIDRGSRLADVNGDGLVDFLWGVKNTGHCFDVIDKLTWLNNGTGWQRDDAWIVPECFVDNLGKEFGIRLGDVNGDGLIDIIKGIKSDLETCNLGTDRQAYINTGNGWSRNDSYAPPTNNFCFVKFAGQDLGVRMGDLNGDSLVDLSIARAGNNEYCYVGNGVRETWVNKEAKINLLKEINLEFGGNITIDYQKSTSLEKVEGDAVGNLGFNVWVVGNITEDNQIEGVHNNTVFREYNYSKGFYDYPDSEFRGFEIVEEKIEDKTTKHYFNQSDSLKGREFKTEILDDNDNLYQVTEKTFEDEDKGGYFVVSLIKNLEFTYDGDTDNKTKETSYDYDVFGNLIYKHSKGNIGDTEDDNYEFYDYVTNNNSWIVNTLKNYTLFDEDNATMLRGAIYRYDDLSFGVSPTKGGLTTQEDLIVDGKNRVTNSSYDGFGNVVNQTNSNGERTEFIYGVSDNTNTFVDKIIDAKGFVTNYSYDLGSGNLLGEVDSNGFIKNYTYDELAIDENTILPLDSFTYPTQEYSYDFETVDEGKIIVKQREEVSRGTLDSYKFYDGFGRLIQSKKEGRNNKQIVIDYYYDGLGRIEKQSNPYFVSFSADYTTPDIDVSGTVYVYDQLDRIINITNPDLSEKGIIYDDWNVAVYDENLNKKSYEVDAYGNIVFVFEYNNGEVYETTYAYNGASELMSIEDSLSNNWSYSYDELGRKIEDKDPDKGIWNYSYDSVGNLISQTDSRNKTIDIEYDGLNRKTKEITEGDNINYTYDSYTDGTLSGMNSNNLTFNYSYDDRLRNIKKELEVLGINFPIDSVYDSADRVVSQILPDGRNVSFDYDEQGLVFEIEGYANISYNANSNPLNISYNNNLLTNYAYNESNFRLSEIETAGKQDLDYKYDKVGNVVGINDSVNNLNYSMSYDDLGRLVSTDVVGALSVNLDFVYDQIGNLVNVTGTNNALYSYGGERPHAVGRVEYY
jgi:YD repeat-containing protein